MRNPFSLETDFSRDDSGQAIVEYILMVAVVVAIIGVLSVGLRGVLVKVWGKMARDIAAPCAGCQPPPDVRIR